MFTKWEKTTSRVIPTKITRWSSEMGQSGVFRPPLRDHERCRRKPKEREREADARRHGYKIDPPVSRKDLIKSNPRNIFKENGDGFCEGALLPRVARAVALSRAPGRGRVLAGVVHV